MLFSYRAGGGSGGGRAGWGETPEMERGYGSCPPEGQAWLGEWRAVVAWVEADLPEGAGVGRRRMKKPPVGAAVGGLACQSVAAVVVAVCAVKSDLSSCNSA